MKPDPFMRFLGATSTDPLELLGLTADQCTAARIEAALRERVGKVYQHPDGRSADAEAVRRALRAAAAQLRDPQQRQRLLASRAAGAGEPARAGPNGARADRGGGGDGHVTVGSARSAETRPAIVLTPFDRQALAVLVGCGGWNAECRARLVGLAAAHDMSVQGLATVVTGLSEYAKSGGSRLGVSDITSGSRRMEQFPVRVTGPAIPFVETLVARASEELRADPLWAKIKLSVVFGVLTVLLGVIAVRTLFRFDQPPQGSEPSSTVAAGEAAAVAPVTVPRDRATATTVRPTPFTAVPTFRGERLPDAAVDAADEAPQLPAVLAAAARKLEISDDPSEAVFRSWSDAIERAATGWVLVDDGVRAGIERAIVEVLHEAGNAPSVSDRLLAALAPPSGRLAEPLDLWRGAWRAGMLARIRSHGTLPPLVTEQSGRLLEIALREDAPQGGSSFDVAASTWLGRQLEPLVGVLEFDPSVYDHWELWLAAALELRDAERVNALLMSATGMILRTRTDLSQAGPSTNVLGRLLGAIDWEHSAAARDGMVALFDDASVESHDLWVITSLLGRFDWAPWFGPELVVADDADALRRSRARDRIRSRWPYIGTRHADGSAVAGTGVAVDAGLLERWIALQQALGGWPSSGPAPALIHELVLMSRLNEAASLLASQDEVGAALTLGELERDITLRYESPVQQPGGGGVAPAGSESPLVIPGTEQPRATPSGSRGGRGPSAPRRVQPPVPPPPRAGQPIGRDGLWSESYRAARSVEERMEILRSLLQTAGTDLGPLDAELLVHEAYRGAPQQLRTLASDLVVELFSTGPNVAMEMRDQLHDASANEMTSDLVGQLTGRVLPPARGATWEIEAVLALVDHVLALRRSSDLELEALVELLSDSIRGRVEILMGRRSTPTPLSAPQEAVRQLAGAWLGRAETLIVSAPVPADVNGLERRRITRMRLVDSPIQQFVAWQVTVLDLLAYVTAAEQPARRDEAESILSDCAADRSKADHVLIQAIVTEQAMSRLWKLRLRPAQPQSASRPDDPPAAALTIRAPSPWWLLLVAAPPQETDLAGRLEALRPDAPMAYFELAEEIADLAADEEDRELARHLFALAGALDRFRLGRSACLALADLEEEQNARRRLLALATLLGEREDQSLHARVTAAQATPEAALAIATSFAHYRRGQGPQALEALEGPGVLALLEAHEDVLVGGLRRFREDCKLYRGRLRPSLSDADLDRMLHLELLLLAGAARPWTSELELGYAYPLIEVDPDHLEASLGIDASRSIYRGGRWVEE